MQSPTDPLVDRFTPEDIEYIYQWLQGIDDLCSTPAWEGHELYLKSPTICWLAKQVKHACIEKKEEPTE